MINTNRTKQNNILAGWLVYGMVNSGSWFHVIWGSSSNFDGIYV